MRGTNNMHLKLNKKISFLALGLVAFTLVSCSGQTQPAEDKVKIQFDIMNGIVYTLYVDTKGLIEEPDFSREGYDILGWYTSNDDGVTLDTKWNFFTMGFNYDLTLYAKVEVNTYQIKFVTNVPNETLPQINQRFGTILKLPKLARTGYTFSGWYENSLLTTPFNSSSETMPARDFTLYAKWTINKYSVSYFDIEEIEKITVISDGDSHSVALSDTGRIFTWGRNNVGQLGLGTLFTQSTTIPQIIYPSLRTNEVVTTISAGSKHTLILTNQNRVLGWGDNEFNQLSEDNDNPVLYPTLITMPSLSTNEIISKLYAGVNNSFALTSLGRVFAWGNNNNGQFGNGNSSPNPIATAQVQTLKLQSGSLANDERITDIAPGSTHTLFLSSLNKVYGTGSNNQGQLGIGNFTSSTNLNQITFPQLTNVEFISKIYANTDYSAAVSSLGKVFTWGVNSNNQLGDDSNVRKNIPGIISFTGLTSSERVTELNLALSSAYALTSLGKIYSWGQNNNGQLGSGNLVNRPIPQTVVLNSIKGLPIQLDASLTGLRILTDQGFIFGFGTNSFGQMGWESIGETSTLLTETYIKPYLNTRLVKITESVLDFNQNIVLPLAPSKQGHTFVGWFMDNQYSVPFSPNKMGTSSFSVFAKWSKN